MATMQLQVLTILRAAARRMLLQRAAQTAIAGATAGACCCAFLQVAWHLSYSNQAAASCIPLLPLAVGIALLILRRLGKLKSWASSIISFAWPLMAWSLAGSAIILAGHAWQFSATWLPAVIIPVTAAVNAILVAVGGVSPLEAAAYLDNQRKLREQLSTAAELAMSEPRQFALDDAFTQAVYMRALHIAAAIDIKHVSFRSFGSRSIAALGLGLLLCLGLLLLPTSRPREAAANLRRVSSTFKTMTAQQRLVLAQQLRDAAQQSPAVTAASLQAAADAASQDNAKALDQSLQELATRIMRGEVQLTRTFDPAVLSGTVQDETASGPVSSGNGATTHPDPVGPRPVDIDATSPVVVLNNSYDPLAKAAPAADSSDRAISSIPFDQAWERARLQAGENLRQETIEPRYRRLIESYFLAD